VVINTYLKTVGIMFKKHLTRLISVILIVLISVGFISGIGTATDKINYSLTDYYKAQNVSDIIVKSKRDSGFTTAEIEAVEKYFGAENVDVGMSLDVNLTVDGESQLTRLYFLDFEDKNVNIQGIVRGQLPQTKLQAAFESADNKLKGYELGQQITIDFSTIAQVSSGSSSSNKLPTLSALLPSVTFEICGEVLSPLTFACDGEPSYNNPEDTPVPDNISDIYELITLDNILYIPKSAIPLLSDISPILADTPIFGDGDLYIALSDRTKFQAFSSGYKSFISANERVLSDILGEDIAFITLYDNYSFVSLHSYAEKVEGIGYVLMAAFMFVCALVVFSTMTRLMEEERSQMAILRTLGYSPFLIIAKYIIFAAIATGIGGFAGYFVGIGVATLLYQAFYYSFAMPAMSSTVAVVFFFITLAVIVVAALGATIAAGIKLMREMPAEMLRPKPPRAGRKVFLENIPLIWNRLSFKYKSTVRNVLRYRGRFVMTVVSVAVSMSLVMAGLALLDLCLFGELVSQTVMIVAIVVIVFAGLLTAVVIYTLTNINISERVRELATLKVLGYYENEVTTYIYREIYIDTLVGIIFGYPLSLAIMQMVFSVMAVGSIGGVSWFMWLIAPLIVFVFTFIVSFILSFKIVKINMNDSLKAIE
jgi:putative ABC transport system permease protein